MPLLPSQGSPLTLVPRLKHWHNNHLRSPPRLHSPSHRCILARFHQSYLWFRPASLSYLL
ncbi:hypothetical protein ID866_9195 [Astraeus odoratus]|nr:hypothetical protein ID866_9195 [Astraeus odoratus]